MKIAKGVTANIDENELISLTIYQSKSDLYTSDLWTNNHFLCLHQSTDLNELMQAGVVE